MGVVYTARQLDLDRVVCLKVLIAGASATPNQVERLAREAQSGAKLSHPNIVSVYDFGEHAGQTFYAMEYVQGRTLALAMNGQPLPPRTVALIALRMADALQYAHEHGVIHRDIKPANVLIRAAVSTDLLSTAQWDDADIKVADFGLAKQTDKPSETLTMEYAIIGTPLYMSPEQARGDHANIDAKSDVFSLGVIMYEMLCGAAPMADLSSRQIIDRLSDANAAPPPLPSTRLATVDPQLQAVCLRAMNADRRLRYSSAGQVADDLRRYLNGEKVLARPSRNRTKAYALIAAAAVLLLAVGCAGWYGPRWYEIRRSIPRTDNLIAAKDALSHLNQFVTIDETISESAQANTAVLLKIGNPKHADMLAVCFVANWDKFQPGFATMYPGKRVRIGGRVMSYRGTPEIILYDPRQIEILGSGEPLASLKPNDANLLDWHKALEHVGEMHTVDGAVANASQVPGLTLFNFSRERGLNLTLVVHSTRYGNFPPGFMKLYNGKQLRACGVIESHDGRLQIEIDDPQQIVILGPADPKKHDPIRQEDVIPLLGATKHIGTECTFEGEIRDSSKASGLVFLHLIGADNGTMTLVCHETDVGNFPSAMDQIYNGKTVRVRGIVESYNRRPQITLTGPWQLEFVAEGAKTKLTPIKDEAITTAAAAQSEGTDRTVAGEIRAASRAVSLVFLNFARDSDGTQFTVLVRKESWSQFPANFEKSYIGKRVLIRGTIFLHEGSPQMFLNDPSQITFAAATQPASPLIPSIVITPAQAKQYVGKTVAVEGEVVHTGNRADVAFLNFSGDHEGFAAVIQKATASGATADPAAPYMNKRVRITGKIEMLGGRPEIIVKDAGQIELAPEPAATSQPATQPDRN